MGEKRTVILVGGIQRIVAQSYVKDAPPGWVVTIRPPNRTLDQNDKFHAICTDLERSKHPWQGRPRTKDQWKVLLVSGHAVATGEGSDMVPGLEGEFVNLRESTAAMSKKRGASLITYSIAYCDLNGVELRDVDREH